MATTIQYTPTNNAMDVNKENSSRGNSSSAMELDDVGNKISVEVCSFEAADCLSVPNKSPTQCERQLWSAVSNWIDTNDCVDSDRLGSAIDSSFNAIGHLKELPMCQEVRSFFEDYVPSIVRILLEQLDYGDVDLELKPRIKSLLEQVLEMVSIQLNEATDSDGSCKTLIILTDIFDEVTGYQGSVDDLFGLARAFKRGNGLCNLVDYLQKKVGTTVFPAFGEISAILNMLAVLVEGNGRHYKLCSTHVLPFILHLLSLDQEQLVRFGDDSIDICRRLQTIIRRVAYPKYSEYFNLWRDFIFKMINSSAVPLKLLGYKELQEIAQRSAEMFSPPQAYIVHGAGNDKINGRYEFDPKGLTGGYVRGVASGVKYVRTVPTLANQNSGVEETGNTTRIYKRAKGNDWIISDGKGECYIHRNYNDSKLPPRLGWECWDDLNDEDSIEIFDDGLERGLTLTPEGIMVPDGEELCNLGDDFWYWMLYKNAVLEVIARDSYSDNGEVMYQASRSGHSMLNFIAQMLDRLINITRYDSAVKEKQSLHENITLAVEQVMELLLLTNQNTFQQIIPDFMMKTCDQLKAIIVRIDPSDNQRTFDYLLFRRLLLLRMMISPRLPMDVLEAIPGAHPPDAYFVNGASTRTRDDTHYANGRYELAEYWSLDNNRFVTYTKTDSRKWVWTIHQCLFGPDKGKWFISYRDVNDKNSEGDTKLYVNTSTNPTPPITGWTDIESGVQGPTLTAEEASSSESEQHDVIFVPDISKIKMTEQQSQLWEAVQELTGFVAISKSDRTEGVKNEIKHRLTLLDQLQLRKLHIDFVKCTEMILNQIMIDEPAPLMED